MCCVRARAWSGGSAVVIRHGPVPATAVAHREAGTKRDGDLGSVSLWAIQPTGVMTTSPMQGTATLWSPDRRSAR